MGDLGLPGAYGAAGAADALRQLIKDRLILEQQKFNNDRLLAGDERENRRLDQSDQFRQDTLAETAHQHRQGEAAKTFEDTLKAADVIPAGSQMPFTNPMAGRLSMIGQTKDVGITPADPPSSIAAPTNAAPSMMPDTIANAPGPSKRIVGKLASEKQAEYADTADSKVEAARVAAENRTNDNEQKAKDRIAQIQAAAAARPVTEKLKKVEHKGADGRTVIEYLPDSALRGQKFDKGSSAAVETRLASAEAVNQTGDDIVAKLSDPKVAAVLGPAMGRYNSVQEWLGNPPPELAELAGQIESYAIATMGVHGMRSTTGADKIKEMLSAKHTPESLVQKIKGLSAFSNHLMQNEGRSGSPAPSAGTGKPTAEDLIKKYGGD